MEPCGDDCRRSCNVLQSVSDGRGCCGRPRCHKDCSIHAKINAVSNASCLSRRLELHFVLFPIRRVWLIGPGNRLKFWPFEDESKRDKLPEKKVFSRWLSFQTRAWSFWKFNVSTHISQNPLFESMADGRVGNHHPAQLFDTSNLKPPHLKQSVCLQPAHPSNLINPTNCACVSVCVCVCVCFSPFFHFPLVEIHQSNESPLIKAPRCR